MQTDIQKISDVEYELEIRATSEDLSGDLERALKVQRLRTDMKGFRKGKVPLSLVKKVHGPAVAYGVAEDTVQKTFQETILAGDTYKVLGQPVITDLEYEPDGDLRAVVRFGVRPLIKLAKLDKVQVTRLTHETTDEDVEKELETMIAGQADLIPEEGPAKEDSYVIVDLQQLDAESETPIIGQKKEDLPFLLSDENLLPDLKNAIIGLEPEGSTKVTLPAPDGGEAKRYEVTLREVKRRELPDLDDELVKNITNDRIETVDALRAEIRRQVEQGWQRRTNEFFESEVIAKMIEVHDFQVPASVVDMYLEAYAKEIMSKNGDKLPDDFNEQAFREERGQDAENQARWMFIRDAVIADAQIKVTGEDREKRFEEMAVEGGYPAEMLKRYYESSPQLKDQLDQRILSEKVFAELASRLDVQEKDFKAYNEELKAGDAG